MTPTNFSVLLLAWDNADPTVAVLGGEALPPTVSLVYRLAAERPVLAVYPHLPAASEAPAEAVTAHPLPQASPNGLARKAGIALKNAASLANTPPAEEAEETDEAAFAKATPGVRRLVSSAIITFTSLLIGLEDLAGGAGPAGEPSVLPASKTRTAPASAPVRSQWPTGANAPQRRIGATPAAPYLGASVPATPPVIAPVPSLIPATTVREAADLAHAALSWPTGFSPFSAPAAPPLAEPETRGAAPASDEVQEAGHAPATPLLAEAFDEPTEEMGAAEAHDLDAPADDLTLEAPTPGAPDAEELKLLASMPSPPPGPGLVPHTPPLDGLNYRMIQYARQAAQLVRGRTDFMVIYAPNWPAWLAALEIRNSTGQRLVLYVTSLASSFLAPAERGWLLEVERMTLRRAHLILVPTDGLREQLHQAYGAAAMGEVRVVPAGDENALQAALREVAAG